MTPLVQIDCAMEAELCKMIVSYMVKQGLPVISHVNESNLEELKSLDTPVLIAHIAASDVKSSEVFTAVAEKLGETYIFASRSDLDTGIVDTTVPPPFIILHNPLDEVDLLFQEEFEAQEVAKFAESASKPLIGKFGLLAFDKYTKEGIPLGLIFAEEVEERRVLSEAVKNIALKHRTILNFATVDAKSFAFLTIPFGVEPTKLPAFVIRDTLTNDHFVFDQDTKITTEAIDEFVQGFVDEYIQRDGARVDVPNKIGLHDEI
ncbi:hypothetical protein BP6252_11554 [Coleophoma cylindrospora]|uniref:Uncharacterized protein n=1 Tax=Coleophoma cylindrospora TaxID=1849047 RepID=A0A3D8QK74_9HELO|nr:hypothetical protein BP6252_11554 [Coleophoma cylindrospora]